MEFGVSQTARRLIVGISGASGTAYGVAALRMLRALGIETHLVMSRSAMVTLAHELPLKVRDVQDLASVVHRIEDVGAPIASGSFRTMGMLVAPCSVHSLSEIAYGNTSNLLTRAVIRCSAPARSSARAGSRQRAVALRVVVLRARGRIGGLPHLAGQARRGRRHSAARHLRAGRARHPARRE